MNAVQRRAPGLGARRQDFPRAKVHRMSDSRLSDAVAAGRPAPAWFGADDHVRLAREYVANGQLTLAVGQLEHGLQKIGPWFATGMYEHAAPAYRKIAAAGVEFLSRFLGFHRMAIPLGYEDEDEPDDAQAAAPAIAFQTVKALRWDQDDVRRLCREHAERARARLPFPNMVLFDPPETSEKVGFGESKKPEHTGDTPSPETAVAPVAPQSPMGEAETVIAKRNIIDRVEKMPPEKLPALAKLIEDFAAAAHGEVTAPAAEPPRPVAAPLPAPRPEPLAAEAPTPARAVAEDNGMSEAQLGAAIANWKAAAAELAARDNIARELAAVRPDLPPKQVAAVAELQARYERRLREVVLPPTTPAEATAARGLSATFENLQNLQRALSLPVTEKPERVTKADHMRRTYRRHHNEAGDLIPVRRRGRPRRVPAAADAAPTLP